MKIYTERTYYLLIMLSQVAIHKTRFLDRLKTCVESKTLKTFRRYSLYDLEAVETTKHKTRLINDCIKIKNLCSTKNSMNKLETSHRLGENYLQGI